MAPDSCLKVAASDVGKFCFVLLSHVCAMNNIEKKDKRDESVCPPAWASLSDVVIQTDANLYTSREGFFKFSQMYLTILNIFECLGIYFVYKSDLVLSHFSQLYNNNVFNRGYV